MTTPTPNPRPPRPPRWRRLRILALYLLLILGGTLAVLFVLQGQILFPGHSTQGRPIAQFTPTRGARLIPLITHDGIPITALFAPALQPDGSPLDNPRLRPTVLFFYGNAMCLADTADLVDLFRRRLGANVMIPDYPGYGLSQGKPSETAFRHAGMACLAHLRQRPDVDPSRIVLVGWSIGGAVAIDLASREGDAIAGLVALSTFTSIAQAAREVMPWFSPATLLLRHRFESERKIKRVLVPILLVHGRDDPIIPFAMLNRLAGAARSRPAPATVTTLAVDNAQHNDIFDVGGPQLEAALAEFLNRDAGP